MTLSGYLNLIKHAFEHVLIEKKLIINKTIQIVRNVEFFLKIISVINDIWFDFFKIFCYD